MLEVVQYQQHLLLTQVIEELGFGIFPVGEGELEGAGNGGDVDVTLADARGWLDEPTNLAVTVSFQVVAALTADLAITKRGIPSVVAVGQPISYTLSIVNRGPDAATEVIVTDTLPAELTYVSAESSQGSCAQQGGAAVCALGALTAGSQVTITLLTEGNSWELRELPAPANPLRVPQSPSKFL